jgi:hypothetical protein
MTVGSYNCGGALITVRQLKGGSVDDAPAGVKYAYRFMIV